MFLGKRGQNHHSWFELNLHDHGLFQNGHRDNGEYNENGYKKDILTRDKERYAITSLFRPKLVTTVHDDLVKHQDTPILVTQDGRVIEPNDFNRDISNRHYVAEDADEAVGPTYRVIHTSSKVKYPASRNDDVTQVTTYGPSFTQTQTTKYKPIKIYIIKDLTTPPVTAKRPQVKLIYTTPNPLTTATQRKHTTSKNNPKGEQTPQRERIIYVTEPPIPVIVPFSERPTTPTIKQRTTKQQRDMAFTNSRTKSHKRTTQKRFPTQKHRTHFHNPTFRHKHTAKEFSPFHTLQQHIMALPVYKIGKPTSYYQTTKQQRDFPYSQHHMPQTYTPGHILLRKPSHPTTPITLIKNKKLIQTTKQPSVNRPKTTRSIDQVIKEVLDQEKKEFAIFFTTKQTTTTATTTTKATTPTTTTVMPTTSTSATKKIKPTTTIHPHLHELDNIENVLKEAFQEQNEALKDLLSKIPTQSTLKTTSNFYKSSYLPYTYTSQYQSKLPNIVIQVVKPTTRPLTRHPTSRKTTKTTTTTSTTPTTTVTTATMQLNADQKLIIPVMKNDHQEAYIIPLGNKLKNAKKSNGIDITNAIHVKYLPSSYHFDNGPFITSLNEDNKQGKNTYHFIPPTQSSGKVFLPNLFDEINNKVQEMKKSKPNTYLLSKESLNDYPKTVNEKTINDLQHDLFSTPIETRQLRKDKTNETLTLIKDLEKLEINQTNRIEDLLSKKFKNIADEVQSDMQRKHEALIKEEKASLEEMRINLKKAFPSPKVTLKHQPTVKQKRINKKQPTVKHTTKWYPTTKHHTQKHTTKHHPTRKSTKKHSTRHKATHKPTHKHTTQHRSTQRPKTWNHRTKNHRTMLPHTSRKPKTHHYITVHIRNPTGRPHTTEHHERTVRLHTTKHQTPTRHHTIIKRQRTTVKHHKSTANFQQKPTAKMFVPHAVTFFPNGKWGNNLMPPRNTLAVQKCKCCKYFFSPKHSKSVINFKR